MSNNKLFINGIEAGGVTEIDFGVNEFTLASDLQEKINLTLRDTVSSSGYSVEFSIDNSDSVFAWLDSWFNKPNRKFNKQLRKLKRMVKMYNRFMEKIIDKKKQDDIAFLKNNVYNLYQLNSKINKLAYSLKLNLEIKVNE